MSYLVNQPVTEVGDDHTSPDKSIRIAWLAWFKKNFEAYQAYLAAIKHRLPSSVYEFAIADWHYNPQIPRCPHDAWVQEIKIREIAEGASNNIRRKQIDILLLGAYHDRLLKLTYLGVHSYSMISPESEDGHGDWMIDEIRLSERGFVIHEIEFRSKAVITIECKDILFQERLTASPYTEVWAD